MSRTSKPEDSKTHGAGLRVEYRFDYKQSAPNRFAGRAGAGHVVVVLDPDVAKVFKDGADVNKALRALLTAMPAKRRTG